MKQSIFELWLTRIPENNRLERIWLLAKTDFKKRYYGSILGLFWALINPLAQLAIYYYVFTVVFRSRTSNFVLFLFLGLVLWMFFAESSKKSIHLIRSKRFLLENIQINRLDIYISSTLSTLLGFLFNFSVYFLTSLFFTINLKWDVVFFPLLLLNLILFILAVQIILSIIHIFIRDILHIWNLTVMMLFWFSGILFDIDPDATWKTKILTYLTPIFGIVDNSRSLLIYGTGMNWGLFIYDFSYTIILLTLSHFLLNRYFGRALEMI